MILSKEDYLFHLESDRIALGVEVTFKNILFHRIWRFERLLRKCEYYANCKGNVFMTMDKYYSRFKLRRLSEKLNFSIPMNTIGPGLSIAHYGTIVINSGVRIGENCRLHVCVNIGASGGVKRAPQLGNNVYIAPGSKIFGDIELKDNTIIGANSVVNKSFGESNILIAGMPAKILKKNYVKADIINATDIVRNRIKEEKNYLRKATGLYKVFI